MSADNLYLIRRAGDRWAVSMEFASSDPDLQFGDDEPVPPLARALAQLGYPTPIDSPRIRWFDDLDAARAWAFAEYSEYGVSEHLGEDASGDTFAARLASVATRAVELAAAGVTEDEDPEDALACTGGTNHPGERAATVSLGNCTVRVEAPTFEEAFALASWIECTSPAALAAQLAPELARAEAQPH